ncbi:MAG: hypothetical protein ABI867_22085 [Kofleriaceae bacterium]
MRYPVLIALAACGAAPLPVPVQQAPFAAPTPAKPDAQLKIDLEQCTKAGQEKDKLIKSLEAEVARLTNAHVSAPKLDDAATAASKQFIEVLGKTRAGIGKCHQDALAKMPDLAGKTVTLSIMATYATDGTVKSATFSPSLGDSFDRCMKTLSTTWKLTPPLPAMSFKSQITLTP